MVDTLILRRGEILQIAYRHGVTRLRVFESMGRGEARPDSDVDLHIDVGPNPSPWFPGGLVAGLEALLRRRVHVVTEAGRDALVREEVLAEAVPLSRTAMRS